MENSIEYSIDDILESTEPEPEPVIKKKKERSAKQIEALSKARAARKANIEARLQSTPAPALAPTVIRRRKKPKRQVVIVESSSSEDEEPIVIRRSKKKKKAVKISSDDDDYDDDEYEAKIYGAAQYRFI